MRGTLGEYILQEKLDDEGWAQCWRAENGRGDAVLLKVSDPERIPADRAVRSFERLTRALTRWGRQQWRGVEVPSGTVLPDASGRFGLATEWVGGDPALRSLPSDDLLRLEAALAIGRSVAEILSALHDSGAVHGAVAEDQVRWIDGQVVLRNFWWTQAGLRDHPGPLAPEVIASGRADAASDQWAWGRLVQRLTEDVVTPEELRQVIERCLHRDPRQRYGHLREAIEDIRAVERKVRTDDLQAQRFQAHPSMGLRLPDLDEAQTEDLQAAYEPPTMAVDEMSAERQATVIDPQFQIAPPEPTKEPTFQMERVSVGAPRKTPVLIWALAVGLLAAAGIIAFLLDSAEPPPKEPPVSVR